MGALGISTLTTCIQLMSCCSVTMQSKTIYKKKEKVFYKEIEPISKDHDIALEDTENLSAHNCHLIEELHENITFETIHTCSQCFKHITLAPNIYNYRMTVNTTIWRAEKIFYILGVCNTCIPSFPWMF